ncbi:unnamed protein product, partial [Sphenostylis stenocarpa]
MSRSTTPGSIGRYTLSHSEGPRRKVRNYSELEQLLQRITEIRGYTKFRHSKGRNSKSKTKESEKLKVERNANLCEKEKSKEKSCGT